jgi:hypothetical protein
MKYLHLPAACFHCIRANVSRATSRSKFFVARYAPPSFEMIECAKDVYDIIRAAQRAAGAS